LPCAVAVLVTTASPADALAYGEMATPVTLGPLLAAPLARLASRRSPGGVPGRGGGRIEAILILGGAAVCIAHMGLYQSAIRRR
jgi:hypothetical protein